jgi:hypothetical protein
VPAAGAEGIKIKIKKKIEKGHEVIGRGVF